MAAPPDRSLPRLPSAEVLHEIERQYTAELRKEAKRYAEKRIPMLRHAGYPISRRCADELVHDAVTSTWLGESDPWDPAECKLLTHVCGVIKKRAWREVRRRLGARHMPLDPSIDGDVERVLASAYASVGDVSPILLCSLVATVCAELRRIAPADEEARDVLECWENGFADRRDVMLLTGLGEDAYRRARDRLLSRKQYLPAKLCELVGAILDRSAS